MAKVDIIEILLQGLGGLILFLIFGYVARGASKPPAISTTEGSQLRVHRFYQIIGYFAIAAGAFICIAVLLWTEDSVLMAISIGLLMAFAGWYCLQYYRNHTVVYDDEKIGVRRWTGSSDSLKWSEIESMKQTAQGYIQLRGAGKKLELHIHLVGLDQLLRKITQATGLQLE